MKSFRFLALARGLLLVALPSGCSNDQNCLRIVQDWTRQCLVDAEPADLVGFDVSEISRSAGTNAEVVVGVLSHGCMLSGKGRPPQEREFELASKRCGNVWLVCVAAKRGIGFREAFKCDGKRVIGNYALESTQPGGRVNPPPPETCTECVWPSEND